MALTNPITQYLNKIKLEDTDISQYDIMVHSK